MTDLSAKYQRLAHEYAKLKAQNQVLKKSVLESQENTSELQEQLQSKEQIVRRSQQEIESTNFRSQQMVRRVELLQMELEQLNRGKKGKIQGEAPSHTANSALDEDLRNKILENEMLHKQVHEFDMRTKQIEENLTGQVDAAKREAKLANETLESMQESFQSVKEKLLAQNSSLENKSQNLEEELEVLRSESSNELSELRSAKQTLEAERNELSTMVQSSIVFNDNRTQQYLDVQLATYDKRAESKLAQVLKQAGHLVEEICKSLSNFHKFTEKRCFLYPIDGNFQSPSATNQQLSKHLTEESSHIQTILQTFFQVFLDPNVPVSLQTKFKLKLLEEAFHKYKNFFAKLFPYQLNSLKEECETSICAVSLQTKNVEYLHLYEKLLPGLCKAHAYFHVIAATGKDLKLPMENVGTTLKKLSQAFSDLHLVFKEMSKAFNGKIALEYELPTTTSSSELRSTNEILLSSMLSLASNFAKLSGFINEHAEFFTHKMGLSSESSVSIKRHGTDYMRRISVTTPPPSVPYHDAIRDRSHFATSNENRGELLLQLEKTSTKLHTLEQEKEHWLLETQLLQMKFEKMKLQQHTTPHTNGIDAQETNRPRTESISFSPTVVTMLGDLRTDTGHMDKGANLTEDLIKQHLSVRLTEIGLKMQQAEAKTLHFESECHVLHKHLMMAKNKQNSSQNELNVSSQKISQLQDELSVTRRSYEEQLSLMSEHLAAMNDKLASQKDEIENLKVKKPEKRKLKMPGLH